MKKNKLIPICAVLLSATVLLGGAALAGAGDRNDPLITLSYLQQTIIPDLLKDAADEADDVRDDMERDFANLVDKYSSTMEQQIANAQKDEPADDVTSAFSVITLAKDETRVLPIGAEVMLRIGSAKIVGGSPAAINTTTAANLSDGSALAANNLYLVTIDGRTLTATADGTKVLIKNG